jgi:hypothetical protein
MRQRYASDGYDQVRKRRLRRIERRAVSELTAAFAAGKMSLRGYDLLSRHSAARQRQELAAQARKRAANALATEVIRSMLARSERIDLAAVAAQISESIRLGTSPCLASASTPTFQTVDRSIVDRIDRTASDDLDFHSP